MSQSRGFMLLHPWEGAAPAWASRGRPLSGMQMTCFPFPACVIPSGWRRRGGGEAGVGSEAGA